MHKVRNWCRKIPYFPSASVRPPPMSLLAPLPGAGLDCLLAAIDAMHTPLPAPARKPLDAADDVVTRKTGAVKTAGRRCKALLVHSLCRSQPSCAVHTCAVCSYETRANSMSVPLRRSNSTAPVCGNCWEFFERPSHTPILISSLRCYNGRDACGANMMRTGKIGVYCNGVACIDRWACPDAVFGCRLLLSVVPIQQVPAVLHPAAPQQQQQQQDERCCVDHH